MLLVCYLYMNVTGEIFILQFRRVSRPLAFLVSFEFNNRPVHRDNQTPWGCYTAPFSKA